jgi:hypothetical protein
VSPSPARWSAGAWSSARTAITRSGDGLLGIDLEPLESKRRPLVRGCLDWSERELHVAGSLGAALTARLFELGWIVRRDGTRSVEVTSAGRDLFAELGV